MEKTFKDSHFPFETYNSTLLKPLDEVSFAIRKQNGKPVNIKVKRHEFLDLNKGTGEFYVRNKFTGTDVILHGDSFKHQFESSCLKNFLKNINTNFLVIMDGRNNKTG